MTAPACDLGAPPPLEAEGPELHLVATYPENGAGTECTPQGPADCGVPRNVAFELRFDRYLLPKTAVRQSVLLYTGSRSNGVLLQPFYDVVERVVVFRVSRGGLLEPGLLYHFEVVSPLDTGSNGFGFRAFDGAPLSKTNDAPVKLSFFTARETPVAIAPPEAPSCFDASSVISRSGCAGGGCHSGSNAPMGLRLDSREGLLDTAIAHVAHEADTGPVSGQAQVDPLRFGTGMPIIDPGAPGTSYLLYKLLTRPDNFGACTTKYNVELPEGVCPAPTEPERRRLLNWFVRLEPMPIGLPLDGGSQSLDLLQRFIASGPETDNCP